MAAPRHVFTTNQNCRTCPVALLGGGHHDASGKVAGGVWFPAAHLTAREVASNQPLVWRLRRPPHISSLLITDTNPGGTITNSDLELVRVLLHLEALTQTFDIRERTVLSNTDDLNILF